MWIFQKNSEKIQGFYRKQFKDVVFIQKHCMDIVCVLPISQGRGFNRKTIFRKHFLEEWGFYVKKYFNGVDFN